MASPGTVAAQHSKAAQAGHRADARNLLKKIRVSIVARAE